MAPRTFESERIDMTVMSPRDEAVILGRPEGMTGIALGVHIDQAGHPRRRRLPAVTAYGRACSVGIACCRTALCIVYAQERDVHRAVEMPRRRGSRAAVTGIADIRHAGQRIM